MTDKICVTGGAGMIGSRLVRTLAEQGWDVVVVDNLWRGKLSNLEGIAGFDAAKSFRLLDLAERTAIEPLSAILRSCHAVVHLADIVAGIGYVFNNQYEVFRQNNLINTNTFCACAEAGVKRILYAGTACSFPKNLQLSLTSVLTEKQLFPAEPESAYGWSKLMGSLELQFLAERHGIAASTLMLHNVYGPNCDLDPKRSQVIPSIIRRMLELPDDGTLVVWGSGNQGRAFIHVDDVTSAFMSALGKDALSPYIQIGPDYCTSIRELVETLRDRVIRKPLVIEYDTSKPEGDIGRCADYSLASRELGWKPRVSLKQGLAETVDWIADELRVPA
jgi:GDP-D-mannose 3',5'-epimerase